MKYYKVVDQELLKKIEDYVSGKKAYIDRINDFIKLVGAKSYAVQDSLLTGFSLTDVGVRTEDVHLIDQKKWLVKKTKNPEFKKLEPSKRDKEHYKLYHDNFPTDSFSYKPLLDMVIVGDHLTTHAYSLNVSSKLGAHFAFQTNGFSPQPGIIEISRDEYLALQDSKAA